MLKILPALKLHTESKINKNKSLNHGMIEEKKDFKQQLIGKEHVKIVGEWDIKENSALKDPGKLQLNLLKKISQLMT